MSLENVFGRNSSRLTLGQVVFIIFVILWMVLVWRFVPVMLFILIISQLIAIAVTKSMGVPITGITFGFPPRMASFTLGRTEYQINLVPVSLFITINEYYLPDSKIFRFLIYRSTLLAFFFVGMVALILGSFVGGRVPSAHVEVTDVYSGSPAYHAGLQPFDVIYKCNGEEISSIQQLSKHLYSKKKHSVPITLIRDNNPIDVTIPLKDSTLSRMSSMGWNIRSIPLMKVIRIDSNSIASASGLELGDVILQVDGLSFPQPAELKRYIIEKLRKGEDFKFTLKRDGVILPPIILKTPNGNEKAKSKIGVKVASTTTELHGNSLMESLRDGIKRTVEVLVSCLVTVFFPVGFTSYPMDTSLWDEIPFNIFSFFQLVGFVSMFLLIFNSFVVILSAFMPNTDLYKFIFLYLAIVILLKILLGVLSGIPALSFITHIHDLASGRLLGIGNIISFTL